jgi:hypothetical protein
LGRAAMSDDFSMTRIRPHHALDRDDDQIA